MSGHIVVVIRSYEKQETLEWNIHRENWRIAHPKPIQFKENTIHTGHYTIHAELWAVQRKKLRVIRFVIIDDKACGKGELI